jgi:hypothetical protein
MEAWEYFDQAARRHFIRLIKQEMPKNPEIKQKAKVLKNKDYCARLLYILNMFAYEGDQSGEFDLDWALLLAQPLSASQARRSISDLIDMNLMAETTNESNRTSGLDKDNEGSELFGETVQRSHKQPRRGPGGRTSTRTQFDFDS